MSESDIATLDPLSLCIFIALTIVANAASGILVRFGWRSAVEREIEICKGLTEISTNGDMNDLISDLKASIRTRSYSALSRQGGTKGFLNEFKARVPELCTSTAICWVVILAVMLPISAPMQAILITMITTVLSGILIQGTAAFVKASTKREHGNPQQCEQEGNE